MSWTARAEVLADTTDLGADAAMMCGRARATGLDPNSIRSLLGATLALGVRPLRGEGWTPYRLDRDLAEDLVELSVAVHDRGRRVEQLVTRVAARRATLRRWLFHAESEDARRPVWRAEITDCTTALEVLGPLPRRLAVIIAKLAACPVQLGETYAAVYALVAAGRVMPHDGRWLTGEVPCSST
ncbi:hypothetical protein [Nonomuraea sp. NPDC003804]|uniref:hypothetical protein n=1 Tax=Nonomuraea sp. NPDC003804 TaxID=3154547 RepID=UPI0033B1665E